VLSNDPPWRDPKILAHRIRRHAVMMTSRGQSSHVGSVLSMADILAVLYGRVLNVDPSQPKWDQRDRVILSKGHGGAGIYAALAERGFFPVERLKEHYQNGSIFSGHVSHKGVPGVDLSTGSLGHGLGVGAGMALAAQRGGEAWRVFVVMSDGECDEGSIWEAAMFAGHHQLANLTAMIDYNHIQSLASVADTLALEPFADKWRAFGWDAVEVDGHDHAALEQAISAQRTADKPRVVIAHTTKGKGVSFMESQVLWHYRSPQGDELAAALAELDAADPEARSDDNA
jgi:transketolase